MSTPLNPIKILTYNIHKGFSSSHLRFVLHHIKNAIDEINPDIVCLQEIQGEHTARQERIQDWPSETQFEFLARQIWPHFVYGKNAIYKRGHHGNAILSKFPFLSWENIDVSFSPKASRSLLHAVAKIPGYDQPFHIVCIHLGLFRHERKKQLRTLSERIESHIPHHEALIVAGDFNDWLYQAEFFLETDLNLQEAFKTTYGYHAKTFPVWRPTLPMDRIYSRGFKVVDIRCLTELPWKKLSDHAALYAELLPLPITELSLADKNINQAV
jgi:endonuclease/exonuclease/phosphatase family metal-dependent hydrolase